MIQFIGADDVPGHAFSGVGHNEAQAMQFRFGPQDLHRLRVLVVEDEPLVAADLSDALIARGAELIGPVGTLAEAMRAVATHWIDWAVLDVNLGGEMSFELADRLERAGIPYVLATAYRADQLPERFRAKPRLEKPYRLETLAGMMAA